MSMSSCSSVTPHTSADEFAQNHNHNINHAHSRAHKNNNHNKKIQKTNVLGRTPLKYRKRNRYKYVDPLLIVNKLERARARRTHTKPNYLPIPPQILSTLKHKKHNKKPKKQHTPPPPHVQSPITITKTDHHSINKTAYLYPQMLSPNDPTSFVHKHGKNLAVKITLYPKYAHITSMNDKKSYNICTSPTFKIIDEYYTPELHGGHDPYKHISDDYELIKQCKTGMITVGKNAYKHRDKRISGNRLSLQEFKHKIRKYSGGKHDRTHNAMKFTNYRCIDICKRLNGVNGKPPGQHCIQCHLSLQVIPLFCIGEGVIFVMDNEDKRRYRVYIYIIALLCENYPICTFPRCRKGFDKYWVKCAWFNDINGKEYQANFEKKSKLKLKRKYVFDDGGDGVNELMGEPAVKKIKQRVDMDININDVNDNGVGKVEKYCMGSYGNGLLNLPMI